MTSVTRRYRFCASHRLHSNALSEAENGQVYGKCNNPYGHGHDYLLEVSVTGEMDATTGVIVRLADLDKLVQREVLMDLAHRNLNRDVAEFAELVPTTENLALVIAERLQAGWADYFPHSPAHLSGISMQETERNSFEVVIGKAPSAERLSEVEESVIVNA